MIEQTIQPNCEDCGGSGKVCGRCNRSKAGCVCVESVGVLEAGDYISGYDPVVCEACEGTGRAE